MSKWSEADRQEWGKLKGTWEQRKQNLARSNLPRTTKDVTSVLLDFMQGRYDFTLAWPSVRTVAARTGLGRSTVHRHLQAIVAIGLFHCQTFSGRQAESYVADKYGESLPKSARRTQRRFNLYEVVPDHPLWQANNKTRKPLLLPDEQLAFLRDLTTTEKVRQHSVSRAKERQRKISTQF